MARKYPVGNDLVSAVRAHGYVLCNEQYLLWHATYLLGNGVVWEAFEVSVDEATDLPVRLRRRVKQFLKSLEPWKGTTFHRRLWRVQEL